MKLKRVTTVSAFLALGLVASACDGTAETSAPVAGGAEQSVSQSVSQPVKVSWTEQEQDKVVVREQAITEAQAKWLMDARAKRRAGEPVPPMPAAAQAGGPAESSSHALTAGSTSWSDCQNLDWMLVTSGENQSGNIFCAKSTGSMYSGTTIPIGFMPLYRDASNTDSCALCIGTTGCYALDCGGFGNQVWSMVYKNSGSSNLVPSTVAYVNCGPYWIC